jgi:hypothetical protein
MGSLDDDIRRVGFSSAVVAELRALAVAGIGGLTGDCVETGGILMGQVIGDELRLDACEEAPCEHLNGPAYKLNASDRIRLDEVLAARSRVEGYFRTFVSRDPTPEDADEQFVRRYFPRGDCIYLMIRAKSEEECLVTVCWFRDGQPLSLVEHGPFPLLPARVPVIRVRSVLPPPLRAARRERAEPDTPRPRPRWRPALACFVLSMAAGVGFELWSVGRSQKTAAKSPVVASEVEAVHTTPPSSQWADLQLDVHPTGGQLDITWSADVVRAFHVTGGKLTVTDGDAKREFTLDARQIDAGKYGYNAVHRDVAVRLIVSAGDHGVASDSVRLTSAAAAAPMFDPPTESGGGAVVPPATLLEVHPEIPEGIRSRMSSDVVVPVEVRVSERGRVLSAHASDQGVDAVHRYLAERAEKAAKAWQFAPARTRTGTPVASSKTIEFVFTP